MTSLRARAFLPAVLIQFIVALTISQHAFSQKAQTASPTPQKTEASAEKAATKDEACEQSPAASTTPERSGVADADANKVAAFASQPVGLTSPRDSKPSAARSFAFDASVRASSKLFGDPALSGNRQTGTAATYTPLTSEEKMRRAFKGAFLSVEAYAVPLLSAIITEVGEDDLPHKDTDDRVADGLSRFAIHYGRRSTAVLLSNGVYASAFKQDPRYERADPNKGFAARAAHAASRVFVTRGDNGKHQPNYSRFAGQLSASALSNLWERSTPGHDRIGVGPTFKRFGTSFITGALLNVVREFFLKK
ncbi:MAG TPA: hypothetical protein VJ842_11670 [Pyrinomonadaceae bacterium]|nr:hypothetical protein [Pyrinomonadaceae bacterium]